MSRKVEFLIKTAKSLGVYEELKQRLNSNPVDSIFELEDSPDKLYLWDLSCTDEQCVELAQRIKNKYIQNRNRDPKALHIVRNDVAGLREMEPGVVREVVEPWLNNQQGEN